MNNIPVENMNNIINIITIVKAMPNMRSLCAVPFRDHTLTELDVRKQSLGMKGALVIGRYLTGHEALKTLNISKNCILCKDAGIVIKRSHVPISSRRRSCRRRLLYCFR